MTQMEYGHNTRKLLNRSISIHLQRHLHFRKLHIIAGKRHSNQNSLKHTIF